MNSEFVVLYYTFMFNSIKLNVTCFNTLHFVTLALLCLNLYFIYANYLICVKNTKNYIKISYLTSLYTFNQLLLDMTVTTNFPNS